MSVLSATSLGFLRDALVKLHLAQEDDICMGGCMAESDDQGRRRRAIAHFKSAVRDFGKNGLLHYESVRFAGTCRIAEGSVAWQYRSATFHSDNECCGAPVLACFDI